MIFWRFWGKGSATLGLFIIYFSLNRPLEYFGILGFLVGFRLVFTFFFHRKTLIYYKYYPRVFHVKILYVGDRWHVTRGMWPMTHNAWHMTHDTWHVACDKWHMRHMACCMWQVTQVSDFFLYLYTLRDSVFHVCGIIHMYFLEIDKAYTSHSKPLNTIHSISSAKLESPQI